MDLTAFADALQQSGISEWMRSSLKALPIIEAIHVMAVAIVFGTILIVDLRLLGYRDMTRPFTRVFGETLRWTWVGFAVAVVTGGLLFVPNARTYVVEYGVRTEDAGGCLAPASTWRCFSSRPSEQSRAGTRTLQVPLGARIAGGTSILIWTWRDRVSAAGLASPRATTLRCQRRWTSISISRRAVSTAWIPSGWVDHRPSTPINLVLTFQREC